MNIITECLKALFWFCYIWAFLCGAGDELIVDVKCYADDTQFYVAVSSALSDMLMHIFMLSNIKDNDFFCLDPGTQISR